MAELFLRGFFVEEVPGESEDTVQVDVVEDESGLEGGQGLNVPELAVFEGEVVTEAQSGASADATLEKGCGEGHGYDPKQYAGILKGKGYGIHLCRLEMSACFSPSACFSAPCELGTCKLRCFCVFRPGVRASDS